ncbi:hypothetical protein CBM2633_P10017 [Cupriavidus taiwanensis]|uniref:Uncharacterized protein n=2 Tax=Cupriavidus TaxID=106589 RepID=A0A375GNU5_9BURK|nr:hypothetical protein CBM2592_P10017 [Cupriavidus taiwanensis]SOZ40365.1 hypothetical protein CBM2605_P10018 [Cupriavidus neocaledonicus]SOY73994.1 hypothetical protein CBM2588_P10017 [Cupriavidus taiwanensis]SOY74272.1 hypothetical protein CBM2585_P10017 [Cupriavidus taiwanensis]SOY75221.1 hypothetical protein CBM2589_P10017 [Cupriavidus taiwanensis]
MLATLTPPVAPPFCAVGSPAELGRAPLLLHRRRGRLIIELEHRLPTHAAFSSIILGKSPAITFMVLTGYCERLAPQSAARRIRQLQSVPHGCSSPP